MTIAQRSNAKITIRVPATCANLGPGFDVLGLAIKLYNVFRVEVADSTQIEIEGYGQGMPTDETNLFYRAFAHLHNAAGKVPPPLHVQMELSVPPGRGLGSSATAVVGGLIAANEMMGKPFSAKQLLPHAVQLEHGQHPDNVAPALLGGLVVNVVSGTKVTWAKIPVPDDLQVVLFIPDFEMDTVRGRALMPEHYSRADVVFNTSRVALFVAAISGQRYDLLKIAMEDRIHQPYRAQVFPLMPNLIEAALVAGARGACLSGGGSSVLALATDDWDDIASSIEFKAQEAGITGTTAVLHIDNEGAQIVSGEGE